MIALMSPENDHSLPPPCGVFDLSSAEGINDSEKILVRLCRKSFLNLWAYPNPHTDKDMRQGNGSAKEFSDVLVVFGDDVIIFSDKDIRFQEGKELETAWSRWFRHAVTKSAEQLHGAMRWLRQHPDRVFQDAACKRQLPIVLPAAKSAHYHLVAVARGSRQACLKVFPDGFGTLLINSGIEGSVHEQNAFTIGVLDRSKHFVHVFDESSLEVVMEEVDTITDFVQYLVARESFLKDPSTKVVIAHGEAQLMAAYLVQGNRFLPEGISAVQSSLVVYDDSHYSALLERPEYVEKKRLDVQSRVWDKMLERFIQLGDQKFLNRDVNQPNHETEQGLRLMAAEPRFRRCLLVEALDEMMAAAEKKPNKWREHLFTTPLQPNIVYIFLVTPKCKSETYEKYRKFRSEFLLICCRSAKFRYPEANTFVGLGFDHPVRGDEMPSEDLIVFTCDEYTPEKRAEVEDIRREFERLGNCQTILSRSATNFPSLRPSTDLREPSTQAQKKRRKKDKRKAKQSQSSRRRNRR